MVLNQLTLTNFGVYRGEHTFELSPTESRGRVRPVVLFGGVNGGGKTTILDSVQLVLYGKRARCSKRGDKSYDDFLRGCVNQDVDPQIGTAIRLSFLYASEGSEHLYEVTRAWSSTSGGAIRERMSVLKDGEQDGWMSENWNQLVEDLIPFGVAQLCLFDAEKIRFLAEDDSSSQTLGEAIKSLLGLDLAERLVADSTVLEARIAKQVPKEQLSEGEKQFFAVSVLWGLSKASARPLPAIIDTPMGRLDAAHRRQLVEQYFPHASHQVIVLSTDTEIERGYFGLLQPHIARAYHLKYDELTRSTLPEEGYFWEAEQTAEAAV